LNRRTPGLKGDAGLSDFEAEFIIKERALRNKVELEPLSEAKDEGRHDDQGPVGGSLDGLSPGRDTGHQGQGDKLDALDAEIKAIEALLNKDNERENDK
jgi:hypothetical protein